MEGKENIENPPWSCCRRAVEPSQGFRSDEGTNHCTVSDSHLSGTGTGHTQSSIRKALKTELMLEKNSEIGLPG